MDPTTSPWLSSAGSFQTIEGISPEHDEILHQRKHWLNTDEPKYLAVTSECQELLEEAAQLAFVGGTLPGGPAAAPYRRLARVLGESWEPDYLLLKRTNTEPRLVCGCVCFPSSWALQDKMGSPLSEIHSAVPALNATIGRNIETFLDRIKPGVSWLRSNWGLTRSAERNQHPSRMLPRLNPGVTLDQVYFRVEEQSLVSLPRSNGILFGIRLRIIPLSGYARTADGEKLAATLQTMPEPMAQYKGIAPARGRIIELLRS